VNADDKQEGVVRVKVLPRSSRSQIVGKEGDVYKVKLTAPPVEGKANKALKELFAGRLGIPKGNVEIISGEFARIKSVRIRGLNMNDINSLLNATE